MARTGRRIGMAAALLGAWALAGAGAAQEGVSREEGRTWSQEKCARYAKGWADLLARRGARGLGPEFLERHEAFLASGCTARGDVCPRSAEELDVANILTIAAMNAGTASTFLPFACRR